MFCINCGKELQEGSVFCPKCGMAQQGGPTHTSNTCGYSNSTSGYAVKKAHYNIMCIMGLVISLISLLLNFWGIVGIAGTVVSVIGLLSCSKNNEKGKAAAIIGIIIGVFSILYAFFLIMLALKELLRL